MQRKGLWLPRECFTRPVEHLEGCDGYAALKVKGEIARFIFNSFTYIIRPYHFDNIADFLDNKNELEHGIPLVFPELEVRATKRMNELAKLEFILGDNSGTLKAIYEWTSRVKYGSDASRLDSERDVFNNPLHGANIGDTLKIYSAIYASMGTIKIQDHLRVLNDKHYQRVKAVRERVLKEHIARN